MSTFAIPNENKTFETTFPNSSVGSLQMRSIWRPQRANLTVNQRVLGSSPSSGAKKH